MASSAKSDWSGSTLAERLRYLRELRGVSQNALGAAAGIKGGPMSRLARKGRRVAGSLASIEKIARAWGVRVDWLAYGEGPVEAQRLPRPDRYPHRAIAAMIAIDGGVSPAAVESVMSDALDSTADPPVMWWLDRMRLRQAMLERAGPPGREVPPGSTAPPRGSDAN